MANYLQRLIASGARTSSLYKPPAPAPVLLPPVHFAAPSSHFALLEPLPEPGRAETPAPAPLVSEKPSALAPAGLAASAPSAEPARETVPPARQPAVQPAKPVPVREVQARSDPAGSAPARDPGSLPPSRLQPATSGARVRAPRGLRTAAQPSFRPPNAPPPERAASPDAGAPPQGVVTLPSPLEPMPEWGEQRIEPRHQPAVEPPKVDMHRSMKPQAVRSEEAIQPPEAPADAPRPAAAPPFVAVQPQPRREAVQLQPRPEGTQPQPRHEVSPPLPPPPPAAPRNRITIGRVDVLVRNHPLSERQTTPRPAPREFAAGWLETSDLYPFTCKL